MDLDVLQQTFLTNVAGPAYITQRFIPLVEKSRKKVILNITSALGSNTLDIPGAGHMFTSYGISKAAMNLLVRDGTSHGGRRLRGSHTRYTDHQAG